MGPKTGIIEADTYQWTDEKKRSGGSKKNRGKGNRTTRNVVMKRSEKLGIEIEGKHMAVAHRLQAVRNSCDEKRKIPQIIVRLVHTKKKNELLKASKRENPRKRTNEIFTAMNIYRIAHGIS